MFCTWALSTDDLVHNKMLEMKQSQSGKSLNMYQGSLQV